MIIITCEQCATRFNLDESLLKAEGSKVRCSQCSHIFTAFPPARQDAAAPPVEPVAPPADLPVPPKEYVAPDFPVPELETDDTGDMEIDFDIPLEDGEDTDDGFDDPPLEPAPHAEPDLEEDFSFEESLEFDMTDPDLSAHETAGDEAELEISFDDAESDFDIDEELSFDTIPGPETDAGEDVAFTDETGPDLEIEPEFTLEELPDFEEEAAGEPDMGEATIEMQDFEEAAPQTDDLTFDMPDFEEDTLDDLVFEEPGSGDFDPELIDPDLTFEEPGGDELELEEAEITFETESLDLEPDAAVEEEFDGIEFDDLEAGPDDMSFELSEAPDQEQPLDGPPVDEVNFEADTFPDLEMEVTDPDSEPDPDSGDFTDLGDDIPDLEFEEPEYHGTDEDIAPLEISETDDIVLPVMDENPAVDDGPDMPDFEMEFDLADEADDLSIDGEISGNGSAGEDFAEDEFTRDEFTGYDEVLQQNTEPADTFDETGPDEAPDSEAFPLPEPASAQGALPLGEEPEEPGEQRPSPLIEPPDSMGEGRAKPKKKKKRSAMGAPVKVLLLLFILVGAAYVATLYTDFKIPSLSGLNIPYIDKIMPKKAEEQLPPPPPVPDQKSVNGRFVSNDTAGELFIITGKIENPAAIPYDHIQVQGTLFQKGKIKAMTQAAFCGNIISEEVLKTGNITDITAQLNIRQGNANSNVNIRPGSAVPFMLVFSNLPENLQNFTVEVSGYKNPQAQK